MEYPQKSLKAAYKTFPIFCHISVNFLMIRGQNNAAFTF